MSHDLENASALSSSLLVCLLVPWVLCFFFYFGEPRPPPRLPALYHSSQQRLDNQGNLSGILPIRLRTAFFASDCKPRSSHLTAKTSKWL